MKRERDESDDDDLTPAKLDRARLIVRDVLDTLRCINKTADDLTARIKTAIDEIPQLEEELEYLIDDFNDDGEDKGREGERGARWLWQLNSIVDIQFAARGAIHRMEGCVKMYEKMIPRERLSFP